MATQEGLREESRKRKAQKEAKDQQDADLKAKIQFQCPICDYTEFIIRPESVPYDEGIFGKPAGIIKVDKYNCAGCTVSFLDPVKFSKIK